MATGTYIETVGRRKTASARVRITEATKTQLTVNGKDASLFFQSPELVHIALSPFTLVEGKFSVTAVVTGGGISAQAEAVRHGIARALIVFNHEHRGVLKKAKFLKRDPRAKERRKPGLKKARKAPQWSKH